MLKIAIDLPADFVSAGEFLADVQAYEAAGAHAIWLEGGPMEPLTLMAAAAAVTYRVGLATTLTAPASWPDALLAKTLAALGQLSRDRVVLAVDGATAETERLIGALDGRAILMAGADEETLATAVRVARGVVCVWAAAPGAFERVATLRDGGGDRDEFERWARATAPAGRAEWRELLAGCEAAGATGVIVAHAPNLLDILRNPEEDDRRDLAIAVG